MRMSRRMGLLGGGGTLWLFDGTKGGDITENSGGWTFGQHESYAVNEGTHIKMISLKNRSQALQVYAVTKSKIDFSKINTLYVKRTRNPDTGYAVPHMQVWDGSKAVASVHMGNTNAETVISLDVSSITGLYQVRFHFTMPIQISFDTQTYITQVWGE